MAIVLFISFAIWIERGKMGEQALQKPTIIKGSLDEKLPSYEVLKMLRE